MIVINQNEEIWRKMCDEDELNNNINNYNNNNNHNNNNDNINNDNNNYNNNHNKYANTRRRRETDDEKDIEKYLVKNARKYFDSNLK